MGGHHPPQKLIPRDFIHDKIITSFNYKMASEQDKTKLQTMTNYMADRKAGKIEKLLGYFMPNAEVVDAEGKTHKGEEQLEAYYKQPAPEITSVKDPVVLSDGRGMIEFTVKKYMMNWTVKAYFTFDKDTLLVNHIVLVR